ncbi:alpha/beta hydrolase [Croceiramulus getboli]|nr:alpha/beta hydrolase [Flavobacteriaceae bacterium YJPT1-3]
MRKFKRLFFGLVISISASMLAQNNAYSTLFDIPYYDLKNQDSDDYRRRKAVLNIHFPREAKPHPVIIWFHGGGLSSGDHAIPEALKETGNVIVSADYRLVPKVKPENCIDDAAAAIAWVFRNIHTYNGDNNRIFVAGHSAGGYLALMTVMDPTRLNAYGLDANQIAGLVPFSGHTITHFEIRKQRGIPAERALIDSLAPLFFVRKEAPPVRLITGDREKELLGRYEENAYFYRMMKVAGHQDIEIYELDGYGHLMTEPAFPLLLEFVTAYSQGD